MSELILTVINDERPCKELVKKGFKLIKKFSWDRTAECILESCERALKEKE